MYRVTIAYKNGVAKVHPEIPAGSFFEKSPEFRKLLLAKVINSERSAYKSTGFSNALNNMRSQFLFNMYQSHFQKTLQSTPPVKRGSPLKLPVSPFKRGVKKKNLSEKKNDSSEEFYSGSFSSRVTTFTNSEISESSPSGNHG
eukprot:TRINITY_DN6746_c0_g1_i2.p1 TRINITY_DN6746_c0_g1~~TRINITY_DN6746_c0_g1_i2.p1  ORF type:complete len:143 (+),score=22.71 TRINITY_DN6746_c0_g1_i2:147-575(+)